MIDVLGKNYLKTGQKMSKQDIHKYGKLHKAVHIYIFNNENQLLTLKRSSMVDHMQNKISICTGHVEAGEISKETVKRETKEELGIDFNQKNIDYMFSGRNDYIDGKYIDRQIIDVFFIKQDFKMTDFTLQKKEVIRISLINFDKFVDMARQKSSHLHTLYEKSIEMVFECFKKYIDSR